MSVTLAAERAKSNIPDCYKNTWQLGCQVFFYAGKCARPEQFDTADGCQGSGAAQIFSIRKGTLRAD